MWLPHIAKVDQVLQQLVYPEPIVVQAWTTRFRLVIDRANKQAKEAIQSDGYRRTLEHCVPLVVVHYPVGIWLMASAECMGGPQAPTPQRCSAGCSVPTRNRGRWQ
ncbi:hypothetical protein TNCV_2353401 [Trichonephila clavipes]|nr:hypothetical protein TNCV_2353401 [Trichonephila clavipes]